MHATVSFLCTLCTASLVAAFALDASAQSRNMAQSLQVACSTEATDQTGRKSCRERTAVRADTGYILDTSSLTGKATKIPPPNTSTAQSWCETRWRGHVEMSDGSRQPTRLIVVARAKSPVEIGRRARIECRLSVRMKALPQINSFTMSPVVTD